MQKTFNKSDKKIVKDYQFGRTLAVYQDGLQIVHASKNKDLQVTIYCIRKKLIASKEEFPAFNEQIVQNKLKIYPQYFEIIQSENNIYMVFEDLIHPVINHQNKQEIYSFIRNMQQIMLGTSHKLETNQIFMRNNGSHSLCLIPNYLNSNRKTSSLYSRYHNKSIIVEVILDNLNISKSEETQKFFLQNIEKDNIFDNIDPYIGYSQPPKQHQSKLFQSKFLQSKQEPLEKSKVNQSQLKSSQFGNKIYVGIMGQANNEYPDIDEMQFYELTKFAHVNNALKQEAGKAFLQASKRASYQEPENAQEINTIFESVKKTMFDIKINKNPNKSKFQIKMNETKHEENQFKMYFELYMQSFNLFEKTMKSYLQTYPTGFSGIVAAFLLTLVGLLRRLKLYTDLRQKEDIFQLGAYTRQLNYQSYLNIIRQDLAKEGKRLVKLKSLIENSKVPYKTLQILMPFLEDNIELIDHQYTEKYCYSFIRKLLQMKNRHSYHQILVLQTMEVLLNQDYRIIYSEEDAPKCWNKDFYDMQKAQIQALAPGSVF